MRRFIKSMIIIMNKNIGWLAVFVFCVVSILSFSSARAQIPIIPKPTYSEARSGSFTIDENASIQFSDGELTELTAYFSDEIERISGIELPVNKSTEKNIHLRLVNTDTLKAEGYKLIVRPSAIDIEASDEAGLFYGIQSILQTLPVIRTNEVLKIPAMEVVDQPRLSWRGMMLDVSRHFYSTEAIKEIIDLLARYKINRFHWHLTDNEGWRLEIKKYPRLTSVGAWRKEMPGSIFYRADSTLSGKPYRYGGYYTQEQAREIVAYAEKRNITVVPEIDMPGHSGAALAAYPRYSCAGRPQPVAASYSYAENNGIVDPNSLSFNFCPGKDSSFHFLKNVLTEVMDIFPSEYIHIGGDEVDFEDWKSCDSCKRRMKEEGLSTMQDLQGYFMSRIKKFVKSRGRKIIGWDEILKGNLDSSATVMSWRGEKGGIAAAKRGYDVIMSPNDPLYFNRVQGDAKDEPYAPDFSINTLRRVYNYDPLPGELTPAEQDH